MKTMDLWEAVRWNRVCQASVIGVAATLGWTDKLEEDFIALAARETVLLNSLYYA